MNLKNIATIAGKPGLYKIVKPTRNGVIVQTIDANMQTTVAGATNKVSILQEITIYTTDADGTISLRDVFKNTETYFPDGLDVTAKSDNNALYAFMKQVAPDYDAEKVYTSDIKKIVTWYTLLKQYLPEVFTMADDAEADSTSDESEKTVAEPTAKTK